MWTLLGFKNIVYSTLYTLKGMFAGQRYKFVRYSFIVQVVVS